MPKCKIYRHDFPPKSLFWRGKPKSRKVFRHSTTHAEDDRAVANTIAGRVVGVHDGDSITVLDASHQLTDATARVI